MFGIHTFCRSAIIVLTWNGFSVLATVYNSDGSPGNIQSIHDTLAHNGDTITLPIGNFLWTSGITISKAITLQGAGVGQTTVRDAVQNDKLIQITLVAGQVTRLTGIEFHDGGRINVGAAPQGIIHVDGNNTDGSQFRWDHCKWVDLNGYPVCDTVIGVIDHNEVIIGQKVLEWLYPYCTRWNGASYGDGSWAAPVNWGSGDFLFLEDNTLNNTNTTYEASFTDCFGGARIVARHNTVTRGLFANHGTESPGRSRSSRAMDIYSNTIDLMNINRFVSGNRGGTILFHDNTILHAGGAQALSTLNSFRMLQAFSPWGGGDGVNGWDENDPGNPFYSGTVSSASGCSVTVAGSPWTANQWSGYTIRRSAGGFAYIDSNTSNTITFRQNIFGQCQSFSAGDPFTINKVDQSLDQAGAGVSTLISGDNPTPPPGFTQGADACYAWNNTNDGAPFNSFDPDTANIAEGVHYFNNTAKPGYTSYTYPHPLTAGGPPPSPTPPPTPTPTSTPPATPPPTASPTPSGRPRHTPRPHPTRGRG